jgi:ethanolamine ammonia-lyase small subunit
MKKNEQNGRLSETASHILDPWSGLQRWTPARIALGRTGGSLPTGALLDFRLAHARAVDAVHQPFDAEAFASRLDHRGAGAMCLHTAAHDRATFLHRPDLGRMLDDESRERLQQWAGASPHCDLVIMISDGLSALAVERQAPPLLAGLLASLENWKLAPLLVIGHARVAVQDQVGQIVGAVLALMLIGERPGLVAPDSLGAYFVYDPKPGNTDADRNCVSNIRPDGLGPADAARRVHHLMTEARRRRISGVQLKDESAGGASLELNFRRVRQIL